ncbi:MAG: hypothetical protein WCR61_04140 [Bacteroidales bacterium]|nr:hypothetical protein [Bacteroidales bacterium]MDD4655928.1 hypothetical protein [Bacteroidales bacterium]
MRRVLLAVFMFFVFTGVEAQNIIKETKNTFATFGAKITKVVIPSTSLADLMLRDAVNKGWRISPFEFCTMEEYNKIKEDTNYFFLLRVDGRFRNELEPKVEYLTLVKGGPEIKKGIYSSHNIITLPLQEIDDNSGTNLYLLPMYIDLIQNHIYKIQKDISLAFKGNAIYSNKVSDIKGMELLFSMDQLNYKLPNSDFVELFNGNVKLVTEQEIEDAIINSSPNTVVSLLIEPKGGSRGSYCYKLLIGTESHELYFFRRHKVSKRVPLGFTKEDIRKISVPFQF